MQEGHDRNNHSGLKAMTPVCNNTDSLQVKFVPNSGKTFIYIGFTNTEFACMTVGLLKGAQKANEHFAQRPGKVYRMSGQELC